MKTKKLGFFQAAKLILSNDRGEVGVQGEDSAEPVAEAPEADSSVVESADVSEGDSSEQIEASEEVVEEVQASTEEELEEEIQEAMENGASEEEVKSMIRKFNLKVDGKEFEKELDLNDEEAVRRELQLAAKGQKTMQEKAELEKATAQFLQQMKSNPFKAMKDLDPDFDEMEYVSQFVDNLIKENEMTPEEREQVRIKQEYEQLIAERDRLKKEAEEREMAEKTQQLVAQIKSDISKALESDEDLNVNENNIAIIAQEMQKAWDTEKVELNAQQALEIAKKRIQSEYNRYGNMFKSTASMKKYMGNELLEKLREDRAKIANKQAQVKNAKTSPVSSKPSAQEAPKKRVSIADILAGRASFGDDE